MKITPQQIAAITQSITIINTYLASIHNQIQATSLSWENKADYAKDLIEAKWKLESLEYDMKNEELIKIWNEEA